ncbi:ribonuclease H-like domain-containing protein [Tanacetum coccineum]
MESKESQLDDELATPNVNTFLWYLIVSILLLLIETHAKVTASHTIPMSRPDTVTTRLTKVTGSSSDPITNPMDNILLLQFIQLFLMVIFWKLEANVPNDANFDVWIPLALVHEEGYGFKRVTMVKGFFFFKFSSIEGADSMLRDGPWMIYEIPIFLNKWSPLVSLLKEELLHVPVWVKFHDVLSLRTHRMG